MQSCKGSFLKELLRIKRETSVMRREDEVEGNETFDWKKMKTEEQRGV